MVKRSILISVLLVFSCLSIAGTRYRSYSTDKIALIPVESSTSLSNPYCDGRSALFVNSLGTTHDVLVLLPVHVYVGARCRIVFGVDVDAVVIAGLGYFYGPDGTEVSSIQISSPVNSYGAVLTMVESAYGIWTVDQIYGTWVYIP